MIVFEDRQLALGGGIQLTSLWLDIVLWGQIGLYQFLKCKKRKENSERINKVAEKLSQLPLISSATAITVVLR